MGLKVGQDGPHIAQIDKKAFLAAVVVLLTAEYKVPQGPENRFAVYPLKTLYHMRMGTDDQIRPAPDQAGIELPGFIAGPPGPFIAAMKKNYINCWD